MAKLGRAKLSRAKQVSAGGNKFTLKSTVYKGSGKTGRAGGSTTYNYSSGRGGGGGG